MLLWESHTSCYASGEMQQPPTCSSQPVFEFSQASYQLWDASWVMQEVWWCSSPAIAHAFGVSWLRVELEKQKAGKKCGKTLTWAVTVAQPEAGSTAWPLLSPWLLVHEWRRCNSAPGDREEADLLCSCGPCCAPSWVLWAGAQAIITALHLAERWGVPNIRAQISLWFPY